MKKNILESKFKFEQDIVFNPKSEFSYLYLAKIYNKEKNDELEEQNLNTVILINPKNEEALYLLTLLKLKNQIMKSLKIVKKFKKYVIKFVKKSLKLISKLKSLETN